MDQIIAARRHNDDAKHVDWLLFQMFNLLFKVLQGRAAGDRNVLDRKIRKYSRKIFASHVIAVVRRIFDEPVKI
jgi:hypothetical protein